MLFQCWPSVVDDGPTLKQHWLRVFCLITARYFMRQANIWPERGVVVSMVTVRSSASCGSSSSELWLWSGCDWMPGNLRWLICCTKTKGSNCLLYNRAVTAFRLTTTAAPRKACLTLKALKYVYINHGDLRVFFQFEIIIDVSVRSVRFIYTYYTLSVRGSTLYVKIWRM